jgi:hypothetical protein
MIYYIVFVVFMIVYTLGIVYIIEEEFRDED